ncbi:MAG: D-allose transporter subunit [Firmicutes bacterium ADurb.Bin182]|nr:MAG: D-allose transporter subunit [Firmicutes bacterium ADurb.Bin182]
MKRRFIALVAVLMAAAVLFAACTPKAPEEPKEPVATQTPAQQPEQTEQPSGGEKPYIAMISKGFQHQFWQAVLMGAEQAETDFGVEITFDGPPSESDVAIQLDQLNAALAKNPAALCLAALDTESVTTQLLDAKSKGIPVIGFDSGVPNAPEGTIVSTASTDNEAAGALAAEKMFEVPEIKAAIEAATPEAPVIIGVLSQDATSASVTGRTIGFLNKMAELCEGVKAGAVAITGHDKYAKSSTGKMAVELNILVPPTTNITDAQTTAQGLLAKNGLVGVFCSNELTVTAILAATSDGQDLNKTDGKYKDLVVIGFDAGATQKNAVRNGWFYGSITQDPVRIGYLAVELAVKALNGETVDEIVDTGAQFYNAANMDDASIAPLLYD